jgi:hypothetical protein
VVQKDKKNRSNKPFRSVLSCFKPFLTSSAAFRNFRDFLQILVDFLLNRRFSRKGRGSTTFLADRVGGYPNSDLRPTMDETHLLASKPFML